MLNGIVKINKMKTHDDLRWGFKQETELDSIYRQNNNSQPFNEAYVKWLEDKILLASGDEQSESNCNIPLVIKSVCKYGMNPDDCIRKADTCFGCL